MAKDKSKKNSAGEKNGVKTSVKEKVLFILIVVILIGVSVSSVFSVSYLNQYTNMLQENIQQKMAYIAHEAADVITIDQFKYYRDKTLTSYNVLYKGYGDEDKEKHIAEDIPLFMDSLSLTADEKEEIDGIKAALRQFCADNNVIYTYFMYMAEDNWQNVLFDSDTDEDANLSLWYFENPDKYTSAAARGETATTEFGVYTPGYEGIMATYAPVYDEDGKVIGMVGVDISDSEIVLLKTRSRVVTYLTLGATVAMVIMCFIGIMLYRKKASEQVRANMAKSQFLARMSHEIRTPMNAIIGFCRMAGNSDDISRIKDYLVNISDSSNFLLQLINNILDISKIEAGKLSLRPMKISIRALIQNVHSMLKNQADSKKQTYTYSYDENIPPAVMCDNTYLTQVIVNLVSNAIKFTPPGGEISFGVKLNGIKDDIADIQYTVTDNGIGIDPKHIGAIFEPFEQADTSATRRFGGTGLGLTISKMLVEMMGGKISVESKPGAGSTFTFNTMLKIAKNGEMSPSAMQQEPSASQKADIAVDCKGRCFLVAEDNEVNRLIAGSALEEFGAVVEYAENGQIAFNMYLKTPNKYDIIFMDIHMPLMDGYEATRLIRASSTARAKSIPIVAMTANVFREDIEASVLAGMNGHVGKPFNMEQLAEAIKSVLK